MQKEVYYAERAGVILWNAADAFWDTAYAKAVDGSGITDGEEVRFQWRQAEEGKSIELLPAEEGNTGDTTWEEDAARAPYLEYKVRTEQAGEYYFSFYANSPDAVRDSFHLLVNGCYCYTTNQVLQTER